ncbi:MAG: biopolymer transporter ExbD [Pseudomonadota bacterium]|nr:biopolymer transporter ExbD [Pseudomonadota bacterium]
MTAITAPTSLKHRKAPSRNRPRGRFSGTGLPRMRRSSAHPKGEMNVTPFIDVLLVLLVMLIMAVPVKLHETTVDLPTDKPCVNCPVNDDQNTVFITASDGLLWNGSPVTSDELRARIAAASAMDEEPLLRFEPDANAGYDISARTIALIKESGATRFAFVGNGRHKDFGR